MNESMFLQNSLGTIRYLSILRKNYSKRGVVRIRWTSKDFRCNIVGRHILSRRWNPHMSFIVPFQHLGTSRIILLGLSSSFLPRVHVSSHGNTRRQSYPIPLSQLDQNITSTTYWVAKTRAVFARCVDHPIELLFCANYSLGCIACCDDIERFWLFLWVLIYNVKANFLSPITFTLQIPYYTHTSSKLVVNFMPT